MRWWMWPHAVLKLAIKGWWCVYVYSTRLRLFVSPLFGLVYVARVPWYVHKFPDGR